MKFSMTLLAGSLTSLMREAFSGVVPKASVISGKLAPRSQAPIPRFFSLVCLVRSRLVIS